MADRPSQKALAEFVSEAQETIEALDADLLRLGDSARAGEADPDVLNAVFRAAHSLKGLASMFGVERMTRLAHALEDKLDEVRMGRQPLDGPTLDLLLVAPDLFGRIIAEESGGRPVATNEAASVLADQLRTRRAPAAEAGADPLALLDISPGTLQVLTEYEEHRLRANLEKGNELYRARATFDLSTFDTGLEALRTRLREVGEVICALPSADAADPSTLGFDVLVGSVERVEAVRAAAGPGATVEPMGRREQAAPPRPRPAPVVIAVPGPEPAPAPALPPAPEAAAPRAAPEAESASMRPLSQAVRVDIRKLDRLMNVVGELVLVKTGVARLAERLRAGEEAARLGLDLFREARALDRKLAELQTGILEVRMVPLGQIFDKLSRMVRKLTRELGKEIDFQVEGGEVELDKLIAEELSDPLMHLIRNAIDHGVEAPERRRAAGKPGAGRVRLIATQKGSHVQIAVEDDGAGMDDRRLREVAVERGVLPAETAAQLSRREALNLIFLPGFSTATEVTALSGRGVGMDVVKNNIANLSGIIDVATERGKGTRIELTLPVTLAIIRALVAEVAGRTYALPLNSVLEILEVKPEEIRTIETREVVTLRGATLPLVRLGRFFGLPAQPPAPVFVVVVGLAQQRLGMAVDRLVGQQDVVVKPLGKILGGLRGIAGATDLGSRRTVLVLDVGAIIEEAAASELHLEVAG
jgi:two-component system chemotaxis sensor kinase CheA